MKLICVGLGPCRCLVLRFRKANILLDCATPLHSALGALGADGNDSERGRREAAAGVDDHAAAVSASDAAAAAAGGGRSEEAAGRSHLAIGLGAPPQGSPLPNIGLGSLPARGEGPDPPASGVAGATAAGSDRGGGGSSGGGSVEGYELVDLTPFLPLLHTLEIHAALISSPEALLALPYLLQYNDFAAQSLYDIASARPNEPAGAPGTEGAYGGARCGRADAGVVVGGGHAYGGDAFPRPSWHHIGPIKGPVYCTQAALDTAEQLVAERLAAEEALTVAAAAASIGGVATTATPSPHRRRLPDSTDLGLGPLPEPQEALLAACWRRRPPWRAVRYCLDRVRAVRYGQVVALDSYELTAVPYPSGSGFGHAVWQIADGAERCRTVLYLPDAAPWHPFAPPLPLDLVAAPDALLLGPDCLNCQGGGGGGGPGVSTATPAPARPPHQVVKEAVLGAVVAGGSALIPVYATGEAWELLESLAGALASADLGHVPLLVVGPRAGPSLALASVSLEALAPERQAAVYVPQHPFAFDALMQAGRLVAATSLSDPAAQRCLQQPSAVVLAAADSLLYPGGPALELLLRLGPNPSSLLLVPHAAPPAVALHGIRRLYDRAAAAAAATQSASAPPPPMRMRVLHVPLHSGPTPASMLELLFRLQPRHLVASHRDLDLLRQLQAQQQQQAAPGGSASVEQAASLPPLARESVVPYGWLHQVRLALPRNVHSAVVSPELLQRLTWLGAGPGLQLARLNCLLVYRGGAWHADPVPGGAASADAAAAAAALAAGGAVAGDQLLLAVEGGPALGPLLEALAGHGISRVSVRADGEGLRLALDGSDAELTLRRDGAHVETSCPALRHVLTECLMRQLTVL